MRTAVIICAGGIGKRMETGVPKQFIELADGTPILRKTVDAFRGMSPAANIIVVTSPEGFENETDNIVNVNIGSAGRIVTKDIVNADVDDIGEDFDGHTCTDGANDTGKCIDGANDTCKAFVVTGGSERQDSVKNALEFLAGRGFDDDDIVLIHDGARPYVTEEIIEHVYQATCEQGAAIAAVPVKDTIRDAENGTLDRSRLYAVQTPQGFRFGIIYDAVRDAVNDGFYGTDDGGLVEREGLMPAIVPGSYDNIKITTPEDL